MPPWRLLALPGFQLGAFVAEGWAAYRGTSPYSEVPPLAPSLRVVGEAVLDRSFTLAMNLMTGVPHPSTMRRAHADVEDMVAFVRERGWHEDPLGYHQTPPPVDEYALCKEQIWAGPRPTRYEHLSFSSDFAPHPDEPGRRRWIAYDSNHVSHAYVMRHKGPPRPWLVCAHGFGMGGPLVNLRGFGAQRLHDELGLNLVFPCMPLHGPRSPGRISGAEVLAPDYLRLIHLFAQSVWDIRRVIDWVRARGAPRIGLYGLSLGAYNSSLVGALEDDLDCMIAGIPAVDFANVARDNEPWVIRRYDDEFKVDWHTVRAATHVVSPLAVSPRVPHEGRFIFAGIADRVARPDQARALWRHWERPAIHWFSGGHVAGQLNRGIEPFVHGALRATLLR